MAEALELLSEVADSVPVDISKIKASDSVQSHLSTTNSAKRLRNASTGINKGLSAHLRMPDAMNRSAQGFVQAIFSPSQLTLPTAHTPTRPTGPTRLERPICFKFSIKHGILLYCFLSCVITSVRLYINLYGKKTEHDGTQTVKPSGPLPCNFPPVGLVNAIIPSSRIYSRQQWRQRIPCALSDKDAGDILRLGHTRTVYTVKHTSQLVCDSMCLGK
jgi:hypothetical protein